MHYGTDSAFCQINESLLTMEEIKYIIPPYGTSPSSTFCEELKQMQKCVILSMAVTTTILCCSMFEKLDFHHLKLVGLHVVTIKFHQPAAWVSVRQSAAQSSLSSRLGHWLATLAVTLPPQFPPSFSLSLFLSVSLSIFSASLYKPGCSDPPLLATFPPLSVSPRLSASMVSVQTGGVAVDKAAGLQKTHQLPPLICMFRKLSAQPTNTDSSSNLEPWTDSTVGLQTTEKTLEDAAHSMSSKQEADQLKPFKTRPMFSDVVMTALW